MAGSSPFVIRDAGAGDLPAIALILNREITQTTATWTTQPRTGAEMTHWHTERCAGGCPVLVACRGASVVGYGSYGPFRAGQGYGFTVEHSVYVAEGARGQGIATTLIGALVARARASGLHAMIGGIGAENAGSLRLHARHGFVEVGRLPQVGRKFGRWLDLVLMQKLL